MDDRYQIIQRTAELPFGTQFEAEDTLISRKAQIHRFTTPGEDAPSDWKEIYDNASGALTTLNHMGLPIIYDRGVNESGPFLIRQLVEEPTLVSRLEQGPLSEYEVWELAQQLLDIHAAGVTKQFFHGSLSPDRICYATRPGGEKRYYITDFGLGELHNQINGTNEYFGLPCLICRTQAMGGAPSEVSEIFSMGQILYLCLADNHPFAANRVDEMVELHKSYPLAPISESRDDIPQAMVDWLVKMMAVDPKDRFQTYAEALENLPDPEQALAVPIIPTSTTQQQLQVAPVGLTTTAQQTVSPQTGTQGISYTAAVNQTAAVSAAAGGGGLFKNPMVIGGAALAVILLIVGVVVLSSDDDDSKSSKALASQVDEDTDSDEDGGSQSESSEEGLKQGLIVAFNFNESLAAKNDGSQKIEKLKSDPVFEKGLFGKGLVLDQDHYYRLPLKGMLPKDYSSSFTISFWVKNLDRHEPAFISNEPWSSSRAHKLAGGKDDSQVFWQWSPESSFQSKNPSGKEVGSKESWSMITLVFSRKNKKVSVYNNGVMEGSSSTDAIKTIDDEEYLYIGCDSRQKFNFATPTVIDQFYIWNRKLSSKEIRSMFEGRYTY